MIIIVFQMRRLKSPVIFIQTILSFVLSRKIVIKIRKQCYFTCGNGVAFSTFEFEFHLV